MSTDERPLRRPQGPVHPLATGLAPGRWLDRLVFLRGFARHPGQVGSVAPSSAWLERRLVRQSRAQHATTLVELGPGTGGTTAALLRALRPGARLLALELDPGFHRHLARRLDDPRLILELASAEQLTQCLARHGLPAPQAIVSGIPFSTLPAGTAGRIAAVVAASLAPGGRFVAYQVRSQVADYMSAHLGPSHVDWEVMNLPPVRVYTWERGPGGA